jgi:hypothetical protein
LKQTNDLPELLFYYIKLRLSAISKFLFKVTLPTSVYTIWKVLSPSVNKQVCTFLSVPGWALVHPSLIYRLNVVIFILYYSTFVFFQSRWPPHGTESDFCLIPLKNGGGRKMKKERQLLKSSHLCLLKFYYRYFSFSNYFIFFHMNVG